MWSGGPPRTAGLVRTRARVVVRGAGCRLAEADEEVAKAPLDLAACALVGEPLAQRHVKALEVDLLARILVRLLLVRLPAVVVVVVRSARAPAAPLLAPLVLLVVAKVVEDASEPTVALRRRARGELVLSSTPRPRRHAPVLALVEHLLVVAVQFVDALVVAVCAAAGDARRMATKSSETAPQCARAGDIARTLRSRDTGRAPRRGVWHARFGVLEQVFALLVR